MPGGIDTSGRNHGEFSEKQWHALHKLLRQLEAQHPYANIYGHRDLSPDLNGDTLKAEFDQIDPDFAEMVEKGRFKKISASFYLANSPNNPRQGALYLRHVGFLGAMPPAVKGLKNPIFNESLDGVVDGIVEGVVAFEEPSFTAPKPNNKQPSNKPPPTTSPTTRKKPNG